MYETTQQTILQQLQALSRLFCDFLTIFGLFRFHWSTFAGGIEKVTTSISVQMTSSFRRQSAVDERTRFFFRGKCEEFKISFVYVRRLLALLLLLMRFSRAREVEKVVKRKTQKARKKIKLEKYQESYERSKKIVIFFRTKAKKISQSVFLKYFFP